MLANYLFANMKYNLNIKVKMETLREYWYIYIGLVIVLPQILKIVVSLLQDFAMYVGLLFETKSMVKSMDEMAKYKSRLNDESASKDKKSK